jgi:hypothetical protein
MPMKIYANVIFNYISETRLIDISDVLINSQVWLITVAAAAPSEDREGTCVREKVDGGHIGFVLILFSSYGVWL